MRQTCLEMRVRCKSICSTYLLFDRVFEDGLIRGREVVSVTEMITEAGRVDESIAASALS